MGLHNTADILELGMNAGLHNKELKAAVEAIPLFGILPCYIDKGEATEEQNGTHTKQLDIKHLHKSRERQVRCNAYSRIARLRFEGSLPPHVLMLV